MNPHQVTRDFEAALCEYTGAPYAVCVNSCTAALLLACAWHMRNGGAVRAMHVGDLERDDVVRIGTNLVQDSPSAFEIPRRTYVSVPQSIIHAGGRVTFRDEEWSGAYQFKPYPIWDSARLFTGGMYDNFGQTRYVEGGHFRGSGAFVCVSFHASKTLGIEQGGAILHGDPAADAWFRRARFDGRREGVAPKDDTFDMVGWHCYMNPSTAAQGLLRLHSLPLHNAPLPNDPYPDLSEFEVFR